MPLLIVDHPVELLCRMFSYLSALDLYHCSLTCSFLRRVIEDSVELQLAMQLGINRLACFEPLASEPPISTRLELLKRRQRAWRYLQLQWKDKISFEFESGQEMYEYVGGVYSVGNLQSVSMIQLHSSHDGEEDLSTWNQTTDFFLCEYTTDSTQDLMIMVEISPEGSDEFVLTTHMRTMSTNDPHPRAAMLTHGSLARSDHDVTLSWRTTTAQIAGDFVALLTRDVISQTGAFIEIWNWTKVATAPRRCELVKMAGIDDMAFVSATTFLVTCPSHGYIELYGFDDPAVSHSNGPTSKGIFELPMLQPGCSYSYLHANFYPVVGHPHMLNPISSLERPLFYPSQEDRICAVHIPLQSDFGHPIKSTLLIHSRVFFELDPCVSASSEESQPRPWDAWGPQNTRWYPTDWSGWRYASYGLKVIDTAGQGSYLDSDDVAEVSDRRLRLRDFNPYALATSISDDDEALEAWQKGRVVTESSWIPAGGFFKCNVESRLPYREVMTEELFDLTEVIMDENHIVLLKRMGGEGPDKFTVLKI